MNKKLIAILLLTILTAACADETNTNKLKLTEPDMVSQDGRTPFTQIGDIIHENNYLDFGNIDVKDLSLAVNVKCTAGSAEKAYTSNITSALKRKVPFIAIIPMELLMAHSNYNETKCSFVFSAKNNNGSTHSFSLKKKIVHLATQNQRAIKLMSRGLKRSMFLKKDILSFISKADLSHYKINCGNYTSEYYKANSNLPITNLNSFLDSKSYQCIAFGYKQKQLAARSHKFFINESPITYKKDFHLKSNFKPVIIKNFYKHGHSISNAYPVETTTIENSTTKNQHFLIPELTDVELFIFSNINHKTRTSVVKVDIEANQLTSIDEIDNKKKILTIMPGGKVTFNYLWKLNYNSLLDRGAVRMPYGAKNFRCSGKRLVFQCHKPFFKKPMANIFIYHIESNDQAKDYNPIAKISILNNCHRTASSKNHNPNIAKGSEPCHKDLEWNFTDIDSVYTSWKKKISSLN